MTPFSGGVAGFVENGYSYNKDENVLYKIHWYGLDAPSAVKTCAEEGGHLVMIESNARLNFFKSVVSNG